MIKSEDGIKRRGDFFWSVVDFSFEKDTIGHIFKGQYYGLQYFCGYCINRPALIQPVFSEKFCMKVFDFCLSWSLASIKSTRFKTFISESIVRFKRPENQSWILK
jgi:hypothetical protein